MEYLTKEKFNKIKKRNISLLIVLSILLVLVIFVASCNIYFYVISKQMQYGVAKGYEWNYSDTFDSSHITALDAKNSDFKILCISDIHLKNFGTFGTCIGVNYILDWKFENDLKGLVKKAKPDLIIVNGDNVLTPRNDLETARLVKIMDSFEINWATVFGNHDQEGRADKRKLADELLKSKYGLFQVGPETIHGIGNYVLNITRNNDIVYSIYLMDSGTTDFLGDDGCYHEDCIRENQIQWYDWNVSGINKMAKKSVPNMAIFHIPLPQFVGLNTFEQGCRCEKTWAQYKDFGFFDKFKENNGTHIIVGHDHINNFIANYEGVKLCQIQKSSPNCYFQSDMQGGTLFTLSPDNTVKIDILDY